MTRKEMIEGCDPGIREVVRWLLDNSFETTDSGDGVTKPAAGDEDALTEPHVIIRARPRSLSIEADRLARCLSTIGIAVQPGQVQASYDPADEVGVIILLGVNNDALVSWRRSNP
jgi:hypothetical protein